MPAGETEQSPSPWTIDSLHQHIVDALNALREGADTRFTAQGKAIDAALAALERLLDEVDRRYEQRFVAQENATALALARVDKEFHEHLQQVRAETHAALEAADKAIAKAEAATEKRFECVSADTPILCADLIWRPAGDLLVGDELIGVEEVGQTRRGRRYQRSVVTENSVTRDALLAVHTPAGTVRCNRNHPWLVKRSNRSNWQWVEAADLNPGDLVHHAVDVWEVDRSWEGGWLAGMYDGEGCLSMSKGRCQLTLSQRESATSDLIALELKQRLGKDALTYRNEPGTSSTPRNTCAFFHFMVADRPSAMKILGSVRPPRLLVRADGVWDGALIGSWGCATPVTSIESAGSGLIAQLSTSTHTYIAGGFVMHNSVNEFRAQLADQASRFMPRIEAEQRMGQNTEKISGLDDRHRQDISLVNSRLDLTAGQGAGLDKGWGYLIGLIGFAGGVIGIIIAVTQ